MQRFQKSTTLFFGVVFSIGLFSFTGILSSNFFLTNPEKEGVSKTIEVPLGTSLSGLAHLLKKEELISSKTSFIILGKLTRSERKIKPGEYALDTSMGPLKMLDMFKGGKVVLHKIRIPEGYSAQQIGSLLEMKGLITQEKFLKWVQHPKLINRFGINAPSLEGYLFPETYFFPKYMEGDKMIQTMVSRFKKTFSPEWQERAKALTMTEHKVVTLASIIEKETGKENERSLISAVFHNRIKRGMPLQSDPTVIYALPDFNGNLTRKHLSYLSPYNTYRVRGLPPGPIANPGAKSIEAALYPADVKYYYFVSKNDGSHYFSKTLGEHNRAVQHYQMRRSSRHAMKTSGVR